MCAPSEGYTKSVYLAAARLTVSLALSCRAASSKTCLGIDVIKNAREADLICHRRGCMAHLTHLAFAHIAGFGPAAAFIAGFPFSIMPQARVAGPVTLTKTAVLMITNSTREGTRSKALMHTTACNKVDGRCREPHIPCTCKSHNASPSGSQCNAPGKQSDQYLCC